MDWLNEIVRVIAVLQGFALAGISVVTLIAYRNRPTIGHITAVASSHLILTIIVAHSLFIEAYSRTGGKAAFALLAFGLSDFAVLKILSQRQNGTSGELPPEFWRKEVRTALRETIKPEFLK